MDFSVIGPASLKSMGGKTKRTGVLGQNGRKAYNRAAGEGFS